MFKYLALNEAKINKSKPVVKRSWILEHGENIYEW